MNRIYRVIWNCTLQVFQACSELTRRAGKTSTVNLRKSSGLTTKFSRLTLGVLLALSGSASGASLEVDNDQITNIDTDVAYFSGSEGTLNTWYVQPQAQITWMGVKDSDHTRKDGTRIETEGDGNVQTRLGVKTYLNSHHQRDDGKQREFQPYIEANWINNSKVYAVKMNGQTVGREGARNLGEVRTGVEAKVNNNLSLWGNVGVQLGDKGYSDTQGMLGVKYSW